MNLYIFSLERLKTFAILYLPSHFQNDFDPCIFFNVSKGKASKEGYKQSVNTFSCCK